MEAYISKLTGEPLYDDIQTTQPDFETFISRHFGPLSSWEATEGNIEEWELKVLSIEEALQLISPTIEDIRTTKLQALNNDLHSFLDSQGLDQGSQVSFLALYSDVQDELIETGTTTLSKGQLKTAIKQVWTYIHTIVMPAYYGHKSAIEQSMEPENYTWDFSTLAAENPGHTLRSLTGGGG